MNGPSFHILLYLIYSPYLISVRSRLKEETASLLVTKKKVEEEKGELEITLARLEARFEASIQQLKDREEVSKSLEIT